MKFKNSNQRKAVFYKLKFTGRNTKKLNISNIKGIEKMTFPKKKYAIEVKKDLNLKKFKVIKK